VGVQSFSWVLTLRMMMPVISWRDPPLQEITGIIIRKVNTHENDWTPTNGETFAKEITADPDFMAWLDSAVTSLAGQAMAPDEIKRQVGDMAWNGWMGAQVPWTAINEYYKPQDTAAGKLKMAVEEAAAPLVNAKRGRIGLLNALKAQ